MNLRAFVHSLDKDDIAFEDIDENFGEVEVFASKKPVKVQKCEGGTLLNLGEVPTEMDKVVEIAL